MRRVAEVHFKVGLALQFLQNPAKALTHTQVNGCMPLAGGAAK